MLETKELCKSYTPKKGVPVQAVDHISLRFPERGMVFLLGKSGSGKSTMLNLLGGLDSYDSGEIIIKGISSKDFTQQRFDSYRNTYVGFIFQEYNVLEEFTVGANIALALELQGKTATDEEINTILKAVDLDGFGQRKPNELSGGQKQRVAIARALVKNPEIIMADEPTGALDSATGRAVLDTLKKLSAEKLVVIVSHDREYAEQYADRIIELADGKVIRDVEAVYDKDENEKQLIFRAATIEIPADYHLTEEDRVRINGYLDQLKSGASIILPKASLKFRDTDTSTIPVQDGSKFHLIKSELPMKSAFRIGCSSLKHKKFRLVMTILLSCIAFTLFSLVDTFSSYNHIRACTDSLIDSGVTYISLNKEIKMGENLFDTWWSSRGQRISDEEMQKISADTGIPLSGIFIPKDANLSFGDQYEMPRENSEAYSQYQVYFTHFCGYAEITEQSLKDAQYKLIGGKLPDGSKDEIAISAVLADTFVQGGYRPAESRGRTQKIKSPIEMVGKTLRLMNKDYTVSGIIDTRFDITRYERLKAVKEQEETSDTLVNYLLYREFQIGANYTLSGCAMVGSGKVEQLIAEDPHIYESDNGHFYMFNKDMSDEPSVYGNLWADFYTTIAEIPTGEIIWLDKEKTELAENEVVIPLMGLNVDTPRGNGMTEASKMLMGIMEKVEKSEEIPQKDYEALIAEMEDEGLTNWVGDINWRVNGRYQNKEIENMKIVGFTNPAGKYGTTMVIAGQIFEQIVTANLDGVYDSVVGAMPENRADITAFIRYCNPENKDATVRWAVNSPVIYELETVNNALKALAKVFFWIGLFFAVFASLLMANFISTSIHYKRQEIGILRAIGSRSADVFRIFFSESFVIALVNMALSTGLTFAAVFVINWVLRKEVGILMTLLHFGLRQILLLAVVSIGCAALASFFPVRRIASKKPIDAIRDK